jgi:ubiquinone/menaquinone biosynthesis C-methylase UbiE
MRRNVTTEFGVGRGKVFPADKARSLLNPLRRLIQPPSRLAARLGDSPESLVVELGCGPGWFSEAIAARVGHLVMFDLQQEMLQLARSRVRRLNTSAMHGDAVALPFATGAIDAVVVVAVLGEIPDRDACLAEIRRVLRPGGVLLIAETRRDSDFIPFASLRSMVEALGFESLDRRGPSWEYTARFVAR